MPDSNLKRLNKLIIAISKINKKIATCYDEKELFRLTCKYLEKIKSYKLICLGLKDNDSDEIVPICISGIEKDFIKSISNIWTKYGLDESPISMSLRKGLPFVIKDFKKEESLMPWDKIAKEKGFLSSIVLPLKRYDEFIGTLHIYSDIKNYFIKEEIKFLNKVVKDIDIGIRNIRDEKKLADSKSEYKELFNRISSCVAIYEVKNDGNDFIVKNFNRAARKAEKLKKEDIIGKNVLEVFPNMKDFGLFDVFKRVYRTNIPESYPLTFYEDKRISGWRENFIYKLPNGNIVSVYNDLTKKKQLEEDIHNLAKFVEENPNPLGRIDYNGKLLYCNHNFQKIFKDNDYISSKLKDAAKKIAAKKILSKTGVEIEVGDRVFLFDLIPIKREKYINLYGRDITKHKKTDKALYESEERYRTIFDSSSEGILITEIKTQKIKYANKAICQMLGYSEKELTAMNIAEIHMKEDLQVVLTKFKDHISIREPGTLLLLRKDGTNFYAEINGAIITINGQKFAAGFFRDISERQRYLEELQESKVMAERYLNVAAEIIVSLDKFGNITLINDSGSQILGYNHNELTGKNWFKNCVPHKQINDLSAVYEKLMNGDIEDIRSFEKEVRTKSGEIKTILWHSSVLKDLNGNITGTISSGLDITARKKAEQEILHLSFHDHLTGLYNRRFFEEEINRLDTKRMLPLSFIMCDLNSLKLINEAFGHAQGDNIIKETAKIIKKICRSDDILARWGGDEFVIILPKTSTENAEVIAQRIKKECGKTSKQKIPLSLAIGVATKTEAMKDIQTIMLDAESNMYKNKLIEKESSGSSIIFALEQTLHEKSSETMEHALRIKDNAIKLGKSVKLASSQLDELSLLSSLHDIGKIAIPETILLKEGKLTEEEWAVIKSHPEIGFNIVSSSPQIAHIAKYILACHENWDGSGYPRGLAGKAIPILSRIMFIADAYDVMTGKRIYNKAMSKNEAIKELKRCAGTQFDPVLVEKFIEIISN